MNKRQVFLGFSIAELLVMFLLISITMAMTLPIISKRAKLKPATTLASSSSYKLCTKIVTSYLDTTLTSDIKVLLYTMYGGGGGDTGGWYYGPNGGDGGGGGSSAIVVSSGTSGSGTPLADIFEDYAAGGNGGQAGKVVMGSYVNPDATCKRLTIYAGGGGGGTVPGSNGAYGYTGNCNGGWGGGGAGYYGGTGASGTLGNPTSNYFGKGGANAGVYYAPGTVPFNGGDGPGSAGHGGGKGGTPTAGGAGGAGTSAGGGGGGGGCYGGKGGSGVQGANGNPGHCNIDPQGKGRPGSAFATNNGKGGEGGSVELMYMTTSSTCSL